MQCVFLEGQGCYANITTESATWKVDDEAMQSYCATRNFKGCPRFMAKMEFLTKSYDKRQQT